MKRLADYSLSELYDVEAQAETLIATKQQEIDQLLHRIAALTTERAEGWSILGHLRDEIADRTPALYHQVCGYTQDGELLPATEHHRFAVIQRSR